MLANTGVPGRGDQRWAGANVGRCQRGQMPEWACQRVRANTRRANAGLFLATPRPLARGDGLAYPASMDDALSAEAELRRLLTIMAALRDQATGCPWDKEQTFDTIAPYTIEEAYEVADAIARRDFASLPDELGDLLFQVVYHARMAEEDGRFAFADVARAISDKMIRRHPHVFGDAAARDAAAQTAAWEAQKSAERSARQETGTLAGVPIGLPALTRAEKLTKRAARVGFDWPDATAVWPSSTRRSANYEPNCQAPTRRG